MGGNASLQHTNVFGISGVMETSPSLLLALLSAADQTSSTRLSIRNNDLILMLTSLGFHSSDALTLQRIATLLDFRQSGSVPSLDLAITVCPLITNDIKSCLKLAFECFDRNPSTELINRKHLTHVLTLLSDCFFFCGDQRFAGSQIADLVSSLYTSVGRGDEGELRYLEFIEAIASHTLVELFLSLRFQGDWRDKVCEEDKKDFFPVAIY